MLFYRYKNENRAQTKTYQTLIFLVIKKNNLQVVLTIQAFKNIATKLYNMVNQTLSNFKIYANWFQK